ncbi:hypothetical protein BUALT_Bualt05G0093400 [Buddleja alternifolia]|uniref:ribose-5-phosphate isomerase n=1 Tax=Buddleja alternifolia TaxID=168488 RepID=A0AAV6XUB3_9LAMI|nr:hypothetical protein BUALT_Bualt05G0093400 [Buddleja alternifolia]
MVGLASNGVSDYAKSLLQFRNLIVELMVELELNLVKERDGSLLREKMVESASKKFVVIIDESKLVNYVGGSKLAMPVEKCANGEKAYVTDNGNYITDLYFERDIGDLNEASDAILRLPDIVEHVIFFGLATFVIVASVDAVTVKTKVENELEVDYLCYNDLRNGF